MDWLFYLVFNFVLYSFLGWCLEEVYSYFILGYFKTEGFLRAPFKPMYGITMSILVYCADYFNKDKWFIIFPLVIVIPTLVEYISGYLLQKYFDEVYWNYSDNKFNLNGLVCLRFSLYWSVLAGLAIILIQPLFKTFYLRFNDLSVLMALILGIYIIIDFGFTINKYINKKQHFFY